MEGTENSVCLKQKQTQLLWIRRLRDSKVLLLRIRDIVIHQVSSWKLLNLWGTLGLYCLEPKLGVATAQKPIKLSSAVAQASQEFWYKLFCEHWQQHFDFYNIQIEYLRIFGVILLQISESYFRTFPGRPLRNCEHIINCDASLLLVGRKRFVASVSGSAFNSSIEKSDGNFILLLFCCQKESICQWLPVWRFLSPSLLGQ